MDLNPAVGSEQRKTRPAIIVNVDGIGKLPLRIVVPLTDWNDRYYDYSWMVQVLPDKENGLTKLSAADCLSIRAVDTQRFVDDKVGDISDDIMQDILAALTIVLGLP